MIDKASTDATSDIKVEIDRLDQATQEWVGWRGKPEVHGVSTNFGTSANKARRIRERIQTNGCFRF
jgi:hypothetical protein